MSIIAEDDTIVFEPFASAVSLITFTVGGVQYQAEEGMTFYDWALSEYFNSSCLLTTCLCDNLRDNIIEYNISSSDSVFIYYGGGVSIIPGIYTDTIIQPISYMPNDSGFLD